MSTTYPNGTPKGPYTIAQINPKDLATTAKVQAFVNRSDKDLILSVYADPRIFSTLIESVFHAVASHIRAHGLKYSDTSTINDRLRQLTTGSPIGPFGGNHDLRAEVTIRLDSPSSPDFDAGTQETPRKGGRSSRVTKTRKVEGVQGNQNRKRPSQ